MSTNASCVSVLNLLENVPKNVVFCSLTAPGIYDSTMFLCPAYAFVPVIYCILICMVLAIETEKIS